MCVDHPCGHFNCFKASEHAHCSTGIGSDAEVMTTEHREGYTYCLNSLFTSYLTSIMISLLLKVGGVPTMY